MAPDKNEITRREKVALDAIAKSLGTEAGEYAATLFASHHVEEIDSSYWQKHLGTTEPQPAQVLGLLGLKSHWGDDEIETFDFCLPENVSNYVISVRFDERGDVEDIAMES